MSSETKRGIIVGKPALDFTLQSHQGSYINLKDEIKKAPAMLVFYPKDFTPVCTKQLCDYRDNLSQFKDFGVQIFGISNNDRQSHSDFVAQYEFPFLLLSDPLNETAKAYECSSVFMLGNVSRAVFLINTKGQIIYRYIEPTSLTRRKSDDLLQVIRQLRENKLI